MPTATPEPTPTPEPQASEEWVTQPGIVRAGTTSTSSITLPNGTVRTYLMEAGIINFAESSDGRDLSVLNLTNIRSTGLDADVASFVSNPAVLLREDGQYLMVYESSTNPPPNQTHRALFSAVSADGIAFTTPVALPSSNLDMSPQGGLFQSVPDLVRLPDGSIRLYYVARGEAVGSMLSDDDGESWTQDDGYRLGTAFGSPEAAYVDPDAVVQSDGGMTLYIAYSEFEQECGGLGCQVIRVAYSADGLNFTMAEGDLVTAPSGKIGLVDPDVYQGADGSWHMLYGEMPSDGDIDLRAATLSPSSALPTEPRAGPPQDTGSAPTAATTPTTTDLLVSGFVPVEGKGDAPSGTTGLGPWATRIMLASSTDGLTFTRTGEIVADQGGVPNMIVDGDGRVRVYYVAWQQSGNVGGADGNFIAVAIRTAPGEWVYHRVTVEGVSSPTPPVDPHAVLLSDGRYRLYFKLDASISSATSTNGVDFVLDEGERFATDEPVFDPAVLETDSGWRMWMGPDGSYTAFSEDGLEFAPTGGFTVEGPSFHPWSAVAVSGGGYRLYGSLLGPGGSEGISSVFSETGETWQLDTGDRLSATGIDPELEAGFGPDNGVAILTDGTYLIAYLATIP